MIINIVGLLAGFLLAVSGVYFFLDGTHTLLSYADCLLGGLMIVTAIRQVPPAGV